MLSVFDRGELLYVVFELYIVNGYIIMIFFFVTGRRKNVFVLWLGGIGYEDLVCLEII